MAGNLLTNEQGRDVKGSGCGNLIQYSATILKGLRKTTKQPVPNGLVEAGIGQTTLMLQTVYQVVTNRSRRRRQWKVGFSRNWSVALGREVHGATVRSEVAWKCECSCCRASTVTEVRVAHC